MTHVHIVTFKGMEERGATHMCPGVRSAESARYSMALVPEPKQKEHIMAPATGPRSSHTPSSCLPDKAAKPVKQQVRRTNSTW